MSYSQSFGLCSANLSGITSQGFDTLGGTISCDMGNNYSNGTLTIPAKGANSIYTGNLSVQYWATGSTLQIPVYVYYATSVGTPTNIVDAELISAMKQVAGSGVFWGLLTFSIAIGLVISMAQDGVQAFVDLFEKDD